MKEYTRVSELEQGNEYEVWVTSNIDEDGEFTVIIDHIRTDWNGKVTDIKAHTVNGDSFKVYYPNAHVELNGRSIGRVSNFY